MKIVCPACDAAYDVPPSVVSSQRKMRCARCGQDWLPKAPVLDQAPAQNPVSEPAAAPPPPGVPEPDFAPVAAVEPELEIRLQADPAPASAVVLPPAPTPVPPVEALAFTPASFTSFETLPPVIDPLEDTGFEPLVLKSSQMMVSPMAPLLHAVPPRLPGETDPSFITLPPPGAEGPGLGVIAVAWALSFAILLSLGWAGVHWRDGIMKAWPPSEHLYIALGMSDPPAGS